MYHLLPLRDSFCFPLRLYLDKNTPLFDDDDDDDDEDDDDDNDKDDDDDNDEDNDDDNDEDDDDDNDEDDDCIFLSIEYFDSIAYTICIVFSAPDSEN